MLRMNDFRPSNADVDVQVLPTMDELILNNRRYRGVCTSVTVSMYVGILFICRYRREWAIFTAEVNDKFGPGQVNYPMIYI